MKQVYGLTGNIGCGKSTAREMIAELGVVTIDADAVAADVRKRADIKKKIKTEFGNVMFDDDVLSSSRIANFIFNDLWAKQVFEDIMNPAILQSIKDIVKDYEGYDVPIVIELPTLFEAGYQSFTSGNIVIATNYDNAMQRAILKGNLTLEQAKARYATQICQEDKILMADTVVWNDGTVEELKSKIESLWYRRGGVTYFVGWGKTLV